MTNSNLPSLAALEALLQEAGLGHLFEEYVGLVVAYGASLGEGVEAGEIEPEEDEISGVDVELVFFDLLPNPAASLVAYCRKNGTGWQVEENDDSRAVAAADREMGGDITTAFYDAIAEIARGGGQRRKAA
ncbi:hypothetical protein CKO28_18770 [Rhodovibrio sodomensis]|uniref:Uncharacterized protein n=1 Tax=Rhodovibrio sodomensis TaxID=1088 RepID=A0ABS1DJ04_9PROT|nr:hypothetical protein [Rhodovibrio sodomensis]MBK1670082.1 hypothetical protein [Rhodovibrio sodomensis]